MTGVSVAPAVDAQNLYRFYRSADDETFALRGVSLCVQRGELVAVLGPSGSGKSTLLACVAGLDEPDGGSVRICGRTMTRRPEAERAALRARNVGMLFQAYNLIEHLDLTQNIVVAQCLARAIDRRAVDELLEQLDLVDRRRALPTQLSGGETARAGLAVALANRPTVLLADEPTGELDLANALRVLAVLQAHCANGGAAVIVTHSETVSRVADREIRLVDGAIAA